MCELLNVLKLAASAARATRGALDKRRTCLEPPRPPVHRLFIACSSKETSETLNNMASLMPLACGVGLATFKLMKLEELRGTD
jgi:hypothetical protein